MDACAVCAHHCAVHWVIEALQELDGGALAAATAAHQSDGLALTCPQTQTLQHRHVRPGWVVEVHVLKSHVALKVILNRQRVGQSATS